MYPLHFHKSTSMRNFAAFGLLGAAALAAASDVHDLKTDTFKTFVSENDLVLAECMSPTVPPLWCLLTCLVISLCPLVRTLQGPGTRVRRGCNYT